MRKQLLRTTWALLAIVVVAGAQTASTPAEHAALRNVAVSRGENGINIEITANGAVRPSVEALTAPERIVVDLPNTSLATSRTRIPVGNGGVTDVRLGTDAAGTTRVVVDLQRTSTYSLVPEGNGKLVLKLGTADPAQAQSANKEASPAPAVKPVSMALSAAKPQAAQNSASDFQFVEPAFVAKKDVDPATRSAAAASRFVERPEGNLLPTPSAAMQSQSDAPAAVPVQSSSAPAPSSSAAVPAQPAVNLAAEQRSHPQQSISGPKYTGEPISVNLKDVDLKDFFRLIHEISGLNVVLDPDVHGTLTIVLDDVPWDQALDIVLKNNGLQRQLEGNVLRIATEDTVRHEAESRRAAQEAEAMAVEKVTVTRYLSYAHSKDVVMTAKKFLSQRGEIVSDDRTNAVIISDIPMVIPIIDRLIQQLDRKTQEVEIEARVVSATRSYARDIGTQLGCGWGTTASAAGGVSNTTNSALPPATFIGPGSNQIPLFSNLGVTGPTSALGFQTLSKSVQLDAILSMAESRGLLKILSRPRVVTQNNIQAIVKQGVRLPIYAAASGLTPATITYVDAFLKLTVTPQITVENTIFLNLDVENTTPDFSEGIAGNPALLTQEATTQVLVTDGGTVVIGGVIQTNNSINLNQVPVLGSIPWLGNLFKHQAVSSTTQELIFFITPRVVET